MIKMPRALAAAALAGALLPGPAGAAPYPATTSLDLGATTLFMQSDRATPLAGIQLFVSAGLDRETSADNGVAALVAECILETPVDTELGRAPLRDAVAQLGGSIASDVSSEYARLYVEGRPDRLPQILALAGSALAAPVFTGATLASAKAALTEKIDAAERNPVGVAIDMFRQSYFVGGAGLPALGTTANLAGIDPARLQSFFAANYRRSSATVTAVGDVTPQVTAATKTLVATLPPGKADPVTIETKPFAETSRRIITHRDVGAPWLVLGFAAPSPGDRDFGAMLVIEAMLSNVFERNSATTLPAVERSVGAIYMYDAKPASMVVFVNGAEIEPTSALRELLTIVDSLTAQPLRPDALTRYRANAAGSFETDTLSLAERSWLIGNFVSQGVGPDYANDVLDAVNETTGDDIQRVAKKYLANYTVAIVLPRDRNPAR